MPLATAWYSLTSPTLWGDLIAVAGVAATVIVGLRVLPKRRLRCTVVSRTRLMNAPQVVRDNLKVLYKDQELTDPFVTVFEIASTGRSAIPSSSFDNGRSFQLKIDAEIETILSVEYEPSSATKPVLEGHGNVIEFFPELVARREVITTAVLTGGDFGSVAIALNPFSDVEIEITDRELVKARRIKWAGIARVMLVLLTALSVAFGAYRTWRAVDQGHALDMSTLCVTFTEFGETTNLAMQLVSRDIAVHRNATGSIQSIDFSPGYSEDVAALKGEGEYLIAEYQVANTPASRRIATSLQQVLAMLPSLPREGTGNDAKHDIAEFNAVMNQMSNVNVATPGCQE
jgi:hypothetical protein